jgi:hypothetical protein
MQTLKIQIPSGYEIDSFDKLSCEIKLKEKPGKAIERIKTVADILTDHRLTLEEFEQQCDDLEKDEEAYRLLKMLAKSLNEGWTPDWNNENQPKYYPWFYMGGSSGFRFGGCADWNAASGVGSRLCFISMEVATHVAKQFIDLYKEYFTL